ncbi:unnamed protein product, partial [Choristocarpus tenellus]
MKTPTLVVLLMLVCSIVQASRVAFVNNTRSLRWKKCPTSVSTSTSINMSTTAPALKGEKGDGIGGDGIILTPKDGEYDKVVIWLHGLGDTAQGWYSAMSAFNLRQTKFILPTADTRPISLNHGMPMPGWSDVNGLTEDAPEDAQGFAASANRVNAILEAENSKGVDMSRMVVGGFSQGGAVALHLCLRSTKQLAGCVAASSWVPMHKEYPGALGSAAKDIPVAQFHGDVDMVVQYTWGKHSHELMKNELELAATFSTVPGMGHS